MINMHLRPNSVAKTLVWRLVLACTYGLMIWTFVVLGQSVMPGNHHQINFADTHEAAYSTVGLLFATVILAVYIHLNLSVGPQERLRLLKVRTHFLARVFPRQRELRDQILLGDLLVSGGFIDESQLERALNLAQVNGQVLGEALASCGWVADEDIAATIELRQRILRREISQSGAWAMMKSCRAAMELKNNLSFAPVGELTACGATAGVTVDPIFLRKTAAPSPGQPVECKTSRREALREKVSILQKIDDKKRSFLPVVRKQDEPIAKFEAAADSSEELDCESAMPRNRKLEENIQLLRANRDANKLQSLLQHVTFDELNLMNQTAADGAGWERKEFRVEGDNLDSNDDTMSFEATDEEIDDSWHGIETPVASPFEVTLTESCLNHDSSDVTFERKMQSQSHSISIGTVDGRIVPSFSCSADEGRIVPSRVCFVDGAGVCIITPCGNQAEFVNGSDEVRPNLT